MTWCIEVRSGKLPPTYIFPGDRHRVEEAVKGLNKVAGFIGTGVTYTAVEVQPGMEVQPGAVEAGASAKP